MSPVWRGLQLRFREKRRGVYGGVIARGGLVVSARKRTTNLPTAAELRNRHLAIV